MSTQRRSAALPAATTLALVTLLAGCGGGGGGATGSSAPAARASEAVWRTLATPRPTPIAGAPRVSITGLELAGATEWPAVAGVEPTLAVTELFAAGLLLRQDVDFVERRRFAAAAEAERRGQARPEGAPAAGVSRGPDYTAVTTWSRLPGTARLDVVLRVPATGEIVARWRTATPVDADPVSLARTAVSGTLAALDSLGARPEGQDAPSVAASGGYQRASVSPAALTAFLQGLAAEDRWNWERARAGYQQAVAVGGAAFAEASAALARAARLRNGGTLGVG